MFLWKALVTVSVNVDRLLSLVRHTHKFLSRVVNHSDGCVASRVWRVPSACDSDDFSARHSAIDRLLYSKTSNVAIWYLKFLPVFMVTVPTLAVRFFILDLFPIFLTQVLQHFWPTVISLFHIFNCFDYTVTSK